MPNVAVVLREEISRLARKEIRSALEKTRKSAVKQGRDIAALKEKVTVLERKVSALEKAAARATARPASEPQAQARTRFVAKGLVSMRKRLGVSAAELGQLVGVSTQTIYNWERGVTRPGAAQKAKLASFRTVGKREVQGQLAAR